MIGVNVKKRVSKVYFYVIGIILIVVAIVCVVYYNKNFLTDENARNEQTQPNIENDKAFVVEEELEDDIRMHNFPYIELTDKLEVGDYVDIRISFGNGYDYVLLAKKKVLDCSLVNENSAGSSLWLDVNEEEILRMSGAVVDASIYEGSKIYAIKYKNDKQTQAIVNYPVSAAIEALIENDPNIVKRASQEMSEEIRKKFEGEINKNSSSESTSNGEHSEKNGDNKDSVDENEHDERLDVYENTQDDEIVFFD